MCEGYDLLYVRGLRRGLWFAGVYGKFLVEHKFWANNNKIFVLIFILKLLRELCLYSMVKVFEYVRVDVSRTVSGIGQFVLNAPCRVNFARNVFDNSYKFRKFYC